VSSQAKSGSWRGRGPDHEQTNFADVLGILDGADPASAREAARLDTGGAFSARLKGATITIDGVFEAIDTVTWEATPGGMSVVVRGPAGGRGEHLGSLALQGAEVVTQHPEAWRPLVLAIDYYPAEVEGDDHGQQGQGQPPAKGRR